MVRNLRALFGLTGSGQPSRTASAGELSLGSSGSREYGSGSCFSVLLSGITNTVKPVVTLSSAAVTPNGATVADSGVNFEGKVPAIITNQAILLERMDSSLQAVKVTGANGAVLALPSGGILLVAAGPSASASGAAAMLDTTLTFETVGADLTSVRVTVVGTTFG